MKILFISANRIGDAVLTTGILSWLESTYPEATFTIACGPVAQDLFRAVPRLDKLIVLQKQKHHGHWISLWKECIGTHWDIIVDMRNSAVSRLLFSKKKYITRGKASGESKVVDHARMVDVTPPPAPKIWIDAATLAKADRLVAMEGTILALGPAANWAPKSWDIANFIEVAKRMLAPNGQMPNARLMILAAPHERAQVQPLLGAFPPDQIIDLVGQDLLTVAACLKKASLFIGNDSGLMHIAAAMGTPTLGLFGPSDDCIYGPYGPHAQALRTPESKDELFTRLPSPHAREPNLMAGLTVERVMAGVSTLSDTLKIT